MAERIVDFGTDFANFSLQDSVYDIGARGGSGVGVIRFMAQVADYELTDEPDVDNLGGLIGAIGPAKELQNNIGRVKELLGTDQTALEFARYCVTQSKLLTPVERHFSDSILHIPTSGIEVAVMTGGVRNWMARRAIRLAQLSGSQNYLRTTLLVGGNRPMKPAEGPDVVDGMTEADYLGAVIQPQLANIGLAAEVVQVESSVGDDVMLTAAKLVSERYALEYSANSVAIVSNAGAWVQNAGQFRRALRAIVPQFDEHGQQFIVVSDGFKLGETGTEPTATHQNPLTALGQIARNAQELVRHQ